MSVKKKKKKTKLSEAGSAATHGLDGGEGDSGMSQKRFSSGSSAPSVKDDGDGAGSKQERKEKHAAMDQDSKPKKELKKNDRQSLAQTIKSSGVFLREVWKEAKKITWPPRRQVIQETWSVLVLVTFITILVLAYDYALAQWVFGPLEHISKMNAPAEVTPFSGPITPSPIDTDRSGLPTLPFSTPMQPAPPNNQPAPPNSQPAPQNSQPAGSLPINPIVPPATGSGANEPATPAQKNDAPNPNLKPTTPPAGLPAPASTPSGNTSSSNTPSSTNTPPPKQQ